MSKNNSSKFILGAVVGAVAALMLAPFSGRKMRKISKEKGKTKFNEFKEKYSAFEQEQLKPKVNELKEKSKTFWNSTKENLSNKKEHTQENLSEMGDKISLKSDELREKSKSFWNTTKSEVAETAEEVKTNLKEIKDDIKEKGEETKMNIKTRIRNIRSKTQGE